jgi:hypothetical protein
VNNGGDNGPSAVFDIWGNWNPTFVKDSALTLGFNIDLGYSGAAGDPFVGPGEENAGHEDSNTWWGAALYASYKFNKVFTLSGRLEYLHSDDVDIENPKYGFGATGQLDGAGNFPADTQDDFSATLTAAFNIWDNLLTRVEYRADVLQGSTVFPGGFNNNPATQPSTQNHQTVENEVSVEAVYSF